MKQWVLMSWHKEFVNVMLLLSVWYFDGDTDFCVQILKKSDLSMSIDLAGAALQDLIQISHV